MSRVLDRFEKTKAQVYIHTFGDKELPLPRGYRPYNQYRLLRSDPTIALARAVVAAPIISAPWVIDADKNVPQEYVDVVNEEYQAHRFDILWNAVFGCIDFGWQPFEVVWDVREKDSYLGFARWKPLLQDLTDIIVNTETGAFDGVRQDSPQVAQRITIGPLYSIAFAFDVEGTQLYGKPLLENTAASKVQWDAIEESAGRYDRKIAGANWVVHYPVGDTALDGDEENRQPNNEIAQDILQSLESSGAVALPNNMEDFVNDLGKQNDAWRIELLAASASGSSQFVERENYLDKLKVRAMGIPERAILEGTFGTKAEAGEHGNFAIINMDLRHQYLINQLNKHSVNRFVVLNFGKQFKNTIRIKAQPIQNKVESLLAEMYKTLLFSASGEEFISRIDISQVESVLGIPIKTDDELRNAETAA